MSTECLTQKDREDLQLEMRALNLSVASLSTRLDDENKKTVFTYIAYGIIIVLLAILLYLAYLNREKIVGGIKEKATTFGTSI